MNANSSIEIMQQELAALRTLVAQQGLRLTALEDCAAIERLQYMYGYFMDNRMFDEMVDLFTDNDPWMEIGQRGRYVAKARIGEFLLTVLGGGRWGLLRNEVINHVQMQPIITLAADGQSAKARLRAQIHGNSPPTTGHFLFAEGVYENEYVKEDGVWKIKGLAVAMTFYATLEREKIWFPSAPPSETMPPDLPSMAVEPGLGRQFVPWHFAHPIAGYPLKIPASAGQEGTDQ